MNSHFLIEVALFFFKAYAVLFKMLVLGRSIALV